MLVDPAADENAERNRAAEAHDPQRHHPAALTFLQVLLQHRGERGDHDEVCVAEDRANHIRRRGVVHQSEYGQHNSEGDESRPDQPRLAPVREHGAYGDGTQRGAEPEARVQDPVLGTAGIDAKVVLGEHGHQPDERERQEREREQRDQDMRDERVAARDADAGQQTPPAALVELRVGVARVTRPHQPDDCERIRALR